MRITNNMMISNMIRNLQGNIRKLDKTQMQYYTGKKIHRPSDDPVGITRSLKIQADIKELIQYKKNVEDATSWLENTEEAVFNNHEGLKRLRDLMIQGANGVLTTDEMAKVQNEIAQIKEQVISSANTTYSGDYIFSGKNTDQKLLKPDGSYNIDVMQFLDSSIIDHRINYEVGVGELIPINTVGTTLFEAADLTMTVELPEENGDSKKFEFLGAEISITRKDVVDDDEEKVAKVTYEVEIKIGDILLPENGDKIEVEAETHGDEDKNIDEMATKAKIYEEISKFLSDFKTDSTENPDNIDKWNNLLIEKEIPVDINNIEFGVYTNRDPGIEETEGEEGDSDGENKIGKDRAVGIVAKPAKAGLIILIEKIERNLVEGNNEEVSELIGSLDKFLDQSLLVRGEIGAKVGRTELILNRIEDDIINLRELQSKLEDADLAETAIQLMNEENVYRASLQVGARIIQPTLLDFLR